MQLGRCRRLQISTDGRSQARREPIADFVSDAPENSHMLGVPHEATARTRCGPATKHPPAQGSVMLTKIAPAAIAATLLLVPVATASAAVAAPAARTPQQPSGQQPSLWTLTTAPLPDGGGAVAASAGAVALVPCHTVLGLLTPSDAVSYTHLTLPTKRIV